jgi:hypothetical protein
VQFVAGDEEDLAAEHGEAADEGGDGSPGALVVGAEAATSDSGTHQAQWCGEETGETSRPVNARASTPRTSSPRRPSRTATAMPASPITSTQIRLRL